MIIVTVLCITWLIRLTFRFWIDMVIPASISLFWVIKVKDSDRDCSIGMNPRGRGVNSS
jgi:hypothetical protein